MVNTQQVIDAMIAFMRDALPKVFGGAGAAAIVAITAWAFDANSRINDVPKIEARVHAVEEASRQLLLEQSVQAERMYNMQQTVNDIRAEQREQTSILRGMVEE